MSLHSLLIALSGEKQIAKLKGTQSRRHVYIPPVSLRAVSSSHPPGKRYRYMYINVLSCSWIVILIRQDKCVFVQMKPQNESMIHNYMSKTRAVHSLDKLLPISWGEKWRATSILSWQDIMDIKYIKYIIIRHSSSQFQIVFSTCQIISGPVSLYLLWPSCTVTSSNGAMTQPGLLRLPCNNVFAICYGSALLPTPSAWVACFTTKRSPTLAYNTDVKLTCLFRLFNTCFPWVIWLWQLTCPSWVMRSCRTPIPGLVPTFRCPAKWLMELHTASLFLKISCTFSVTSKNCFKNSWNDNEWMNDILYTILCIYIYMVSCPVLTDPPPHGMGGGVGTRIRYTHCISTLCRLSTLPQYYKPPPHHRGGWGILYTTTIPQTTPTPQGGGESCTTTPHGGGGGGDRPTLHHIYKDSAQRAASFLAKRCKERVVLKLVPSSNKCIAHSALIPFGKCQKRAQTLWFGKNQHLRCRLESLWTTDTKSWRTSDAQHLRWMPRKWMSSCTALLRLQKRLAEPSQPGVVLRTTEFLLPHSDSDHSDDSVLHRASPSNRGLEAPAWQDLRPNCL